MANPKLNFVHICDYASFGDGKLNILGIFKSINTRKLPAIHPQLSIVTNISVEKGVEYEEVIKLIRKEDNKEINSDKQLKFNFSAPLDGDEKVVEIAFVGQLNGISFEEAGKYVFNIFLNGVLIGEIPFEVKII